MSNDALNWAFQQKLRSSEKFVLVAIANRAGKDTDLAYPSVARICADTGLNRKTVLRAIGKLSGLTLITDTGQREGKTRGVIVYKLNTEAVPKTDLLSSPKNGTVPKTELFPIVAEAVPILPPSGPVFTRKRSLNRDTEPKGTRTEPSGTQKKVYDLTIPPQLDTTEFRERWALWLQVRRAMKACKDFDLLFSEQLQWLGGFPVAVACETVSQSLRNGWQGLFLPKDHAKQKPACARP